jgi:hypothetical protein
MIYYCTVHSTVVPRLIRNKTLPINLTELTEKMNKNFRTSIVYVFWKKVDGLLRMDVEMIKNIARKLLTHTQIGRADAPQQQIRRRNWTDARFVPRPYHVQYAKYRSESIKQMVRMRN